MNTKFDVGQRVTYPLVHTADGNITGIAVSEAGITRYAVGPKWYTEDDLKPAAEEKLEMGNPATGSIKESKPEPVKLYCFKSYGDWLTKGKVYEVTHGLDGRDYLKYDSWTSLFEYFDWLTYQRRNPFVASCLVPLVRRLAKVREWVLITNQHGSHTPSIQNGAIQFVIKDYGDDNVATKCENVLLEDEYLVLDGYKGDAE